MEQGSEQEDISLVILKTLSKNFAKYIEEHTLDSETTQHLQTQLDLINQQLRLIQEGKYEEAAEVEQRVDKDSIPDEVKESLESELDFNMCSVF